MTRAVRFRAALRRGRGRDSRGAAALEFALVVLPLVALLMGIVTFGLAYSHYVALNNAVREGARLGASTANTPAWGAAVADETSRLYADTALPQANVCAFLIKKTGATFATKQSTASPYCDTSHDKAGTEPSPPPSSLPDGCFVEVWASKVVHLNWIFFQTDARLRAQSFAVYDRTQLCP